MKIKLFAATKAFIKYRGKILVLQESSEYKDGANAGSFDVPGGRIEPGQRFDKSLIREVKEETGLKVKVGNPFFVNEWRPKVKNEQWQIIGTFFECQSSSKKVKLSKDHNDYIWIDPKDYKKYRLIKNLAPAFQSYLRLKK